MVQNTAQRSALTGSDGWAGVDGPGKADDRQEFPLSGDQGQK
jgi:hypothetical protein